MRDLITGPRFAGRFVEVVRSHVEQPDAIAAAFDRFLRSGGDPTHGSPSAPRPGAPLPPATPEAVARAGHLARSSISVNHCA